MGRVLVSDGDDRFRAWKEFGRIKACFKGVCEVAHFAMMAIGKPFPDMSGVRAGLGCGDPE